MHDTRVELICGCISGTENSAAQQYLVPSVYTECVPVQERRVQVA